MDANKTQAIGAPTLDPNRTMMGTAPSLNATVTIKPVQCPVCKQFNPAGQMWCVECGLIFDRALPEDAFGAPAVQLPMLRESGGREHPVRPGQNAVGREGGEILLADTRVSRRHAQITSQDGIFTVEDLGSTNGTFVDGRRLAAGERAPLVAGMTVSFGGLELQLNLPGTPSDGVTQAFASQRTAAISAAPTTDDSPAKLSCGDQTFPLQRGANTFGRKSENDICIADPYVSGRHGVIELADDGFYLTDTGSTNGTMLNDVRLTPNMRTRITPEDVILLGSLQLKVVPKDAPGV